MIISRKGAAANHGVRSVTLSGLKFKLQVNADHVLIKSEEAVYDFATTSRHIYQIKMPIAEVAMVIEALSQGCSELDSDLLREHIRPKVPDLMKIVTVASNT